MGSTLLVVINAGFASAKVRHSNRCSSVVQLDRRQQPMRLGRVAGIGAVKNGCG